MSDPVIETAGLSKVYGRFTALHGLDLAVRGGELYGLLGPNGAGKTTTLRMLTGVLHPTAGAARIGGHDCFHQRAEVMGMVGFAPDEPVFYDYLTGRDLIRFVGTLHGPGAPAGPMTVESLAERLGLADALDEYAMNYSRGMKKKLALVLALLHGPRVLILDEPTSGLDPYATRTMQELLREQAAAGVTILFSTHLLDQAERLCDRVGILARGRLVGEGTLPELRQRVAGDRSLEEIFFELTRAGEAEAPA